MHWGKVRAARFVIRYSDSYKLSPLDICRLNHAYVVEYGIQTMQKQDFTSTLIRMERQPSFNVNVSRTSCSVTL
jgi:hypothetical protein